MSVLETILEAKRDAIARAKRDVPQADVERLAAARSDFRGFAASLNRPGVRIVAEIKRASPSQGDIRPDLDTAALARAYAAGGAAALSVLTEAAFFKGSLNDLQLAREAVDVPVLRKDFVIDPYQVYESAARGADALLLIVRILDDERLRTLHSLALRLGLDVLTEVFDEQDVGRANALGAKLVGINNRDLVHFKTDVTRTSRLASHLAPGVAVMALSGIRSSDDIRSSLAGGIRRFLIGEALVRQPDPAATLREWTSLSIPDTRRPTPEQ
jgi:indole-3-glycerol phosphate synthase